MKRLTINAGERFGELTVLSEVSRNKHGQRMFSCVCSCGKTRTVVLFNLRGGSTRSCGCTRVISTSTAALERADFHGKSQTRTYQSWCSMWSRVRSDSPPHASTYKGRGVTVCDQWKSFKSFFSDMGERPPGMTLDRIDCSGNYEPKNCRWATAKDQARNRRDSIWVHVDGEYMHLHDAAILFNINQKTVRKRMSRGMSVAQSLALPLWGSYV